ncbi:cystathionine gamma-lyase-like [Paramuricea clavata]|uniref:cystathionine gamma-lyase n=1 Tax=Paramuricea clavata TaxID=317549 RepID=A0A7D9EVN9_PARCT|nr:cystathionine gamma-lyase-like [Paramuricea clavata]
MLHVKLKLKMLKLKLILLTNDQNIKGYGYSRTGNPTRDCFEKCVASLEDAKHGIATASGLAALTTLTHLLRAGDHVVVCDDVYGGTNRYFSKVASRFNLDTSMVDVTDVDKLQQAIKSNTKMVWIETPTNPLLTLIDIKAVADVAHKTEMFNVHILQPRSRRSSYLTSHKLGMSVDATTEQFI